MRSAIPALRLFWAGAFALGLSACGGPSVRNKKAVNGYIAGEKYPEAETYLELIKNVEYGPRNAVLYHLDLGTIQHHEGKFRESDGNFDAAERRMDELYTKSVTKATGMLVLNDNTADYAGEPYERVLLNVFRALNYVFLGKKAEALVESRKVERFLQELRDTVGARGVYSDDAFARYLDSLLYADEGKNDDSRISLDAARATYSEYAGRYGTPTPGLQGPDLAGGQGELVFLHYNGVAPRKVTRTFQVAWNEAVPIVRQSNDAEATDARVRNALNAGIMGHAITVAFPAYVQDPYDIVASEVWIDGRRAGSTVLVEDITAIAAKTLSDRMALIKTRAIARAAVKFILAETASRAAAKECEKKMGSDFAVQLCKAAAAALAHGTAAATEVADVRSWSALPAQIRMARVAAASGRHQVSVRFVNAAGAVVKTKDFSDVQFVPGGRTYLAFRTAL
jgi:hypothetical protein